MSDALPASPYRWGLLVIAFGQLGATAQALLAPRSFYDDFPFGRGWVQEYPSYNEHLIQDYGAYTLAAIVALVLAAIWLDRRVVQLALISWLVGSSIHFISHATSTGRFETGDAIVNLAGLLVLVVIPAYLLWRSRHESAGDRGSAGAPAARAWDRGARVKP